MLITSFRIIFHKILREKNISLCFLLNKYSQLFLQQYKLKTTQNIFMKCEKNSDFVIKWQFSTLMFEAQDGKIV